MAAHQPHFAYWGGGNGLWHRLAAKTSINRPQLKNVLFDVHLYYYVIYFKYIYYLK
jgi:hypothetical protein